MIVDEKSAAGPQDFAQPAVRRATVTHLCVIVFAASFLILALLPHGRLSELSVPFGGESVRVARSLAAHGTFSNPFAAGQTGPTAHVAPLYPFLYSLALRAFGTGYFALWMLWTANIACLSFQLACLPLISQRAQLGVMPGAVAAALGALFLFAPMDTRSESFLCGALLVIAFLLTLRLRELPASRTAIVVAGFTWGLLILTNPVTVLLLAAWLACLVMTRAHEHRVKLLRSSAAVAGIALLAVTPWIARNYARFGAFIFVRDNLGLELYASNNSCAAATLEQNIQSGCHANTHPNATVRIAAEVAQAGEVPFNRAKYREAREWIGARDAEFLRLTWQRLRWFWLPSLDQPWDRIPIWLITLASVPGLWIIAQKDRLAAWLIGSAWLCFPLIYYVVQFDPRYRYPIYWASLLAAGCAAVKVFRWIRPGTTTSEEN